MDCSRRFLSLLTGLVVVLCLGGLFGPGRVSATTGPTDFLPPAKFKVPLAIKQEYIGQYVLQSVDPASRLTGGAFGIEMDADTGFLVGIAQFYGYDPLGSRSTWTADMYNFDPTKSGVMVIDLIGPTGVPLFGHLYLKRTKSGDLYGQISLSKSKTRYDIHIHKVNTALPAPHNGA